MDLNETLQKKIEEYNVLNTQLEQGLANRASLAGQIQLLQELIAAKTPLQTKPKRG